MKTLWAFTPALGLACAALLTLGVVTRLAALTLVLAALTAGMTGVPADFLYWLVLLLLPLVFHGAGPIALDPWIVAALRRYLPGLAEPGPARLAALPRVVIVGAGFGGMACAAGLRHAPVSVTLIDRHNYHLFQPLLYQVATAGLAPSDIATPIREVFRDQRNAQVLLGDVTGIDTERREVLVGGAVCPTTTWCSPPEPATATSVATIGRPSRQASSGSRTPPRSAGGSWWRSSAPRRPRTRPSARP